MKVLVTGATGSIGAHLVRMLSERGHTVHALVHTPDKASNIRFGHVEIFEGDITDRMSIDRAIQGCRQVYHTAAYTQVWAKDPGTYFRINVEGTVHVLQSAADHDIERVVYTSTAGVYGPSIHGIISEDKVRDIGFFNEYEGSKALAESRVKDFITLHGLDVVIVSPTRVYGPFVYGEPSSTTLLVHKFINRNWRICPGNGSKLGNYVYIEDVALGHILAMEKGRKGETYLLAGGNYDYLTFFGILKELSGIHRRMFKVPVGLQTAVAALMQLGAEVFGRKPLITPGWIAKGRYDWEVSPEKAVRELGLPVTDIRYGLSRTIDYVKRLSD